MLKAKLYHKYTHVRKKCLILFALETMIMHVFFPCLYMLYELNFWQSIFSDRFMKKLFKREHF